MLGPEAVVVADSADCSLRGKSLAVSLSLEHVYDLDEDLRQNHGLGRHAVNIHRCLLGSSVSLSKDVEHFNVVLHDPVCPPDQVRADVQSRDDVQGCVEAVDHEAV